ncbi:MAG: hypothetical protein KKB20_26225 [Proteobacteria bacterium]|nr:hypothetical protein [Pseudomonadota bacterium]
MRELLLAIESEIESSLAYIRDEDVFISPHATWLPESVQHPCLAIKDGAIERTELTGGMWQETMTVILTVYVSFTGDGRVPVVGDVSVKGVLEIAEDVHEALDENLLSLTGMTSAFSPSEKGAEVVWDGRGGGMEKKEITYQYVREVDRP